MRFLLKVRIMEGIFQQPDNAVPQKAPLQSTGEACYSVMISGG